MITLTNFKLSSINLKKSFRYNALFPGCVFSLPPAIFTRIYKKIRKTSKLKYFNREKKKRFNIKGIVSNIA